MASVTRDIGTRGEMLAFAGQVVGSLAPGRAATVIALSGDLGAGKTTFAQGAALTLGVREAVQSPTFVLEKVYALDGQKYTHLIHIDAYRLKGAHEMRILGWEELVREPGNLILVEWPERIEELIPEDAIRIRFDIKGDGRIIHITPQ